MRARRVRRRLIEEVEVTGLFLFLLLFGLGRGSRGTAAAATAAAATAATATAAANNGELGLAFLDERRDVFAVDGREESRELGIVDFRGDCNEKKNEKKRLSEKVDLRLATVRTRAVDGGCDKRGNERTWITRRYVPEARTALTSASEGESLPPSCACCRKERRSGRRVSGKP
jgi:hypothetical protein